MFKHFLVDYGVFGHISFFLDVSLEDGLGAIGTRTYKGEANRIDIWVRDGSGQFKWVYFFA